MRYVRMDTLQKKFSCVISHLASLSCVVTRPPSFPSLISLWLCLCPFHPVAGPLYCPSALYVPVSLPAFLLRVVCLFFHLL